MRNKLKKVLVVVMAFALLFGVVGVPAQSVQAASKLKKTDFKFTGTDKKHRKGMNNVIKYGSGSWAFYYVGVDTDCEEVEDYEEYKDTIKTKRGIRLGDTKEKVFKKYGKVSLKHLHDIQLAPSFDLYQRLCMSIDDEDFFDFISEDKCAQYIYKKNKCKYRLIFFFDDDTDRVKCILAGANL